MKIKKKVFSVVSDGSKRIIMALLAFLQKERWLKRSGLGEHYLGFQNLVFNKARR